MRKHFNISVAEIGKQDMWQQTVIACALISNDGKHIQNSLSKIVVWLESNWPDIDIERDSIEIIE